MGMLETGLEGYRTSQMEELNDEGGLGKITSLKAGRVKEFEVFGEKTTQSDQSKGRWRALEKGCQREQCSGFP